MKTVDIIPKNTNIEITSFKIVNMNVIIFEKAIISVDLFSNDKFIRNEIILMSSEEYNTWLDDQDVIDLICDRLCFEKKPVEATNNTDSTDSTATTENATEQ